MTEITKGKKLPGIHLTNHDVKQKWSEYIKSLKFGFYVITHPMDGFWDLSREHRGSIAAANTVIILLLMTSLLKLQYTSFLFLRVEVNKINTPMEFAKILIPILLGVVANWGTTTLFDGKGKIRDIYMGLAYSLIPYVLLQLPMILFSNIFTAEEGAFYHYMDSFSMLWCAVLVICAVMMVHDFSLGKAVFALIATAIGMVVILFVVLLFFSLTSDGISYFVSIYKELSFRIN